MTKTNTTETSPLAQTSAEAMEQLAAILASYNETTNRLHESYEHLKTEVNRLRRELKQKNEQLERKSRLAALGEMAAGMAHEIRNPLGGMQLYASLLERDLQEQPGPCAWVGKIIQGVNTLDTIVTDMLAFTQEQSCTKTEANLVSLLAEVMDYVRPRIDHKNVRVELDHVPPALMVQVDMNMIKRVLLNLILNALDAVGEEGRVTITAGSCREEEEYKVRISVVDTGEGIAPENLCKIFNPFFTTKDAGTGLGLAIVHRLVECHGGVITAANGKTSGAVFTVLLP
jgi:signal transduction histidine kinase